MGGGSGGGNTTTTTKSELPEYAKPYAIELLNRGSALSNQQYVPYTGQQKAGFDPAQEKALNMSMQRGLMGNAATNAGQENLVNTLNGNYLDVSKNPAFEQGLKDISNQYKIGTAAQTDSAFNRAGNYGGSSYDEVTENNNRAYSDSMNKFAGDLYNEERTNQIRAATLAPQYADQEAKDINMVAGVGDARQGMAQDQLDILYQNWFNQQQQPYRNLDVLSSSLSGSVGNQGTTIQAAPQQKKNKVAGTLGGAATGASVGSLFGPIGTAVGAGAGGLMGLFG
jgi:hypothetical protein